MNHEEGQKWSYFVVYVLKKQQIKKKVKLDINQISLHYIDHLRIQWDSGDEASVKKKKKENTTVASTFNNFYPCFRSL